MNTVRNLATTGLAAIALIAPVVGISVGSGNDLQAARGDVTLASASQPASPGSTAATPADTQSGPISPVGPGPDPSVPYGPDPLVPYGSVPSGFDGAPY
jgi:hypothetical protein